MSKNSFNDLGNQISDTVRDALQSGDLSRLKQLKDIGPAVQEAVKDISGVNVANSNQNQNINSNNQGQPPPTRNTVKGHPYNQPAPPPQRAQPAWYGSAPPAKRYYVGPSSATGVPGIVLGILGMVATGICALVFGILAAVGAGLGFAIAAGGSLVAFLASGGVTGAGSRKRKLASRIRQYYALLSKKTDKIETLDELSMHTGFTVTDIKKDVKKGMNNKMMPDVRLDMSETTLMQGDKAYQLYLESEDARKKREAEEAERQRRMSDPATAGLEAFKEEGATMLAQIREANDAIPGVEISDKLYTLENTTKRIFDYVNKHPEKLGDTRRFMNYYLPTTLKLVHKYRQYEQAEIQVASIVKAKEEIEGTLDTINTAFLNLLDSLYQDDTLDVSTDIEVLQQVLEQEGLTGKRFTIKADDTTDTDGGEETPSLTL